MTEKEETLEELASNLASANPADRSLYEAAIVFVNTLPDDSPLFVHYRAQGRELWVPPVEIPNG